MSGEVVDGAGADDEDLARGVPEGPGHHQLTQAATQSLSNLHNEIYKKLTNLKNGPVRGFSPTPDPPKNSLKQLFSFRFFFLFFLLQQKEF